MSEHFDVAVVGMELPGIIAAALLAKRGRRVILLDHGDSEPFYKRRGIWLPRVPSLIPVSASAPHVQRIHEELGLVAEVRNLARSPNPSFQVILNKHRCDLRNQSQSLQQEARLEFPELGDEAQAWANRVIAIDERISALLETMPDAPPSNWLGRWRCRETTATAQDLLQAVADSTLFAQIPAQHPLRSLMTDPLVFLGHLWDAHPSTLHAVRMLARFIRGCSGVIDDAPRLRQLLLDRALQSGVVLRRNVLIQQVHRKRRTLTEIQLADSHNAIRADYFVNNCFTPFSLLLPADARHRDLAEQEHRVRATRSLLVQNIIVRKEVIPDAMARLGFLVGWS